MAKILQKLMRPWRLYVLIALVVGCSATIFLHLPEQETSIVTKTLEKAGLVNAPRGSEAHPAPFFGAYKQVQYTTQTQAYSDSYIHIEYPANWQAAGAPVLNGLQGSAVGFGPSNAGAEHFVYVSSTSQEQAITAIKDTEKVSGRALTGTDAVSLRAASGATKLSFSNTTDSGDKMTYYILEGTPLIVLRIHGPGVEQLDTAAQLMLRSIKRAP